MNSSQYINILQNPEAINSSKTQQLEEIVSEFPYFQSARALLLKGLNKTNSYKYNPALKKTAAYTVDRRVLFKLITSPIFINKTPTKVELLEDIEIIDVETIKVLHKKITTTIASEVKKIEPINTPEEETDEDAQKATEVLQIGKPIPFNSTEPHSFNEWMQLISQKPIVRDRKKNDKFSIIDKFIESNPKIKRVDKNAVNFDISQDSFTQNDNLMTETLAKVYLEQKKYENAIKAYHILCLKYPEKSGFFADRIKAIKILQRNKS
ncbi:MAG: hypothetical protein COC22_03355 [Flavobacteriaceae bacterium]|nr:MAG: hypothetical protein COC22_03355 [Flavobacteriaceae bacterium]